MTVVLAGFSGTVYNNRRFDDVHRRIDDLRTDMNADDLSEDRKCQEDNKSAAQPGRLLPAHLSLPLLVFRDISVVSVLPAQRRIRVQGSQSTPR